MTNKAKTGTTVLQSVVSQLLRNQVESMAKREERSISKMAGKLIKKGLEAVEAEQQGAA